MPVNQSRTIGAGDRALLSTLRTVLEDEMDGLLEGFYRVLSPAGVPADEPLLRARQRRHWLDHVLACDFGPGHLAEAAALGQAHDEAGLDVRWTISGYAYLLDRLSGLAVRSYHGRPERQARLLEAIRHLVVLEMDLAIAVRLAPPALPPAWVAGLATQPAPGPRPVSLA